MRNVSTHLYGVDDTAVVYHTPIGDGPGEIVIRSRNGRVVSLDADCRLNILANECAVFMRPADAVLWARAILEAVPEDVAALARVA